MSLCSKGKTILELLSEEKDSKLDVNCYFFSITLIQFKFNIGQELLINFNLVINFFYSLCFYFNILGIK